MDIAVVKDFAFTVTQDSGTIIGAQSSDISSWEMGPAENLFTTVYTADIPLQEGNLVAQNADEMTIGNWSKALET